MSTTSISQGRLVATALVGFVAGLVLMGLLLFLPAGTLNLWQAWLYMALFLVPIAVMAVAIVVKDPQLLERRMRTRERDPAQRKAVAVSGMLMLAGYLIPSLDRRFGWSNVP